MPILQKLIKGSFVIVYPQELGSQTPRKIGSFPIDDLPHEYYLYSHPEFFTNLKWFYLISMVFGRAA